MQVLAKCFLPSRFLFGFQNSTLRVYNEMNAFCSQAGDRFIFERGFSFRLHLFCFKFAFFSCVVCERMSKNASRGKSMTRAIEIFHEMLLSPPDCDSSNDRINQIFRESVRFYEVDRRFLYFFCVFVTFFLIKIVCPHCVRWETRRVFFFSSLKLASRTWQHSFHRFMLVSLFSIYFHRQFYFQCQPIVMQIDAENASFPPRALVFFSHFWGE